MKIEHCNTDKVFADFFTKSLHGAYFTELRNKILNINNLSSAQCQGCTAVCWIYIKDYRLENTVKTRSTDFLTRQRWKIDNQGHYFKIK